jgi:hypothetical protein
LIVGPALGGTDSANTFVVLILAGIVFMIVKMVNHVRRG